MRQTASKGEQIQPSSCISHFLNNGVFTLLIIIRSGIGKSKFTESRLPNQRSISLIDLRDTINWRLARKKSCLSSCSPSASSVRSTGCLLPSPEQYKNSKYHLPRVDKICQQA